MSKVLDADSMMAKELYKELNFKKKVAHFWQYNKSIIYIALFLIGLAVIVYVLRPIPGPVPNLRIKFVNVSMPGLKEESNYMETDYETYLGTDNTCQMELSYTNICEEDETKSGTNIEDMMIQVVTCNLELFIFDEFAMNKLCPTGFVLDLRTCLDSEVLEQVQERLIYHKDIEGKVVPMAIDITDIDYVEEAGIQGDGIYISFVANSPNGEMAKQFVTYILSK